MKERPILFTGPMVRALIDGSKTQTRRVAKEFAGRDDLDAILRRFPQQKGCPHGEVGDRLWVKESYRLLDSFDGDSATRVAERCIDAGYPTPWAPIQYEADDTRRNWQHTGTPPHDGPPKAGKLRPSIFLPRWATRILLEITGVRVERLQEISESDALAEGISSLRAKEWDQEHFPAWRKAFDEACAQGEKPPLGPLPSQSYRALWESLNGAGSWDTNPWVWVVEFKRVQPC